MEKTAIPGHVLRRSQLTASQEAILINKEAHDTCVKEEEGFIARLQEKALTIIVLGASGDLAKKKTYPALFALYCFGLLPKHAHIIGYARSHLTKEELKERVSPACKSVCDEQHMLDGFFERCDYFAGGYDSAESFRELAKKLADVEDQGAANRMFYLAVPPSVFHPAAAAFQPSCFSSSGWNRVVVEKPFGRDSASSKELVSGLAKVLKEEEQYRIDHYLGKEMVQNLLVMRFSNLAFQPLWNRNYIKNVIISFKEPFGTEGRGGYFDKIGIIRDVMQNHLLQVLSLVAMERPVSLQAEHIRDEKVKVLQCINPLQLSDVVLGQYVSDKDGKHPAYIDDDTVPEGSNCPTFATAVMYIRNERWAKVPFILKCGKALDERKAEIRLQFKDVPGQLFGEGVARNELVIRIQPQECTYLKMQVKTPGLEVGTMTSELDLTYASRFEGIRMPDAYERLLLDVLKGDQSQFVRADELEAAWAIFTPLLHKIENEGVKPLPYEYGSRGPSESDKLIAEAGHRRYKNYVWKPRSVL